MKKEQWELMGKIYSKNQEFKKKLTFALDGINQMLSIAPNSYLSLSFGKQSICLAHMIFHINPKLPMYFLASEETWQMYNYKEVIDDFCSKWPISLHIIQSNNFYSSSTWKENRDKGDKDLQNMVKADDFSGVFMGLSKEESRARKITLSIQNSIHPTIFVYKNGKYRCCPIMNWGVREIAAYVSLNNIKLLNIYEMFGLEQRTTARITKKMVNNNGLALLRATNSKGYRNINNQFNILNS